MTTPSPLASPLTLGIDHVGLSVTNLAASKDFFIGCLGFSLVGERPDYPAAFVGDGHTRITLWQVADPATCTPFDRRGNVGLHHLAFKIGSRADLESLHARIARWPGVLIEFSPVLSGTGPKWHFMICEPSGCRIEFAWDPR